MVLLGTRIVLAFFVVAAPLVSAAGPGGLASFAAKSIVDASFAIDGKRVQATTS